MSWIRLRTSRSCPISPTPSSRGVPELCQRFEEEVPESIRQLPNYTKVFLEFRSYKALSIVAKGPAYLSDKEFHRLTFCMMLAWEAPDAASRSVNGVRMQIAMRLFEILSENHLQARMKKTEIEIDVHSLFLVQLGWPWRFNHCPKIFSML
ncbi:hypothetical protein MLD38_002486 [Melastoma candidum]|uniref:Uncharacterized protein n=1 Tax=Melastoma candidum TaxID=119954 RepID=A0ACB9RZJ2_9MYRT|nr:hypothetical protein MLD38_002486 [Melastoma candidum]